MGGRDPAIGEKGYEFIVGRVCDSLIQSTVIPVIESIYKQQNHIILGR